jgi:DNA-directed RNA polymerase specialized sigma24 family protein
MRVLMNRTFPAPVLVDVRNAPVRADGLPLEHLYEEEGARLWRAVYLYAADREVASDAVAEAFAQALRRGNAIRSPDRWVWRTAFRIAAAELKRRRNEGGSLTDADYEIPEETASYHLEWMRHCRTAVGCKPTFLALYFCSTERSRKRSN